MWTRLLASFGETWVLTRPTTGDERSQRNEAVRALGLEDRLHFVEVGLPGLARAWRADRAGPLLRFHYIVWQFAALRRARALHRRVRFDLGWHLTIANTLGSLVARLGVPFVVGPIGGGTRPPWRLVMHLGRRAILFEVIRALAQWLGRHANPWGTATWAGAALILVQNPETREWLPASARRRTVIFPNALLEGAGPSRAERRRRPRRAMYAGLLSPWKGASLAIRAMALLPDWTLAIYGDGAEAARLHRLANEQGVADRVAFHGWRDRSELLRIMRNEADVFVFPSLHDEGGWVVAEAIAAGLPVVCLDRGGPPVLGATPVRAGSLRETVRGLAHAIPGASLVPVVPTHDASFEAKRAALAQLLVERRLIPPDSRGSGLAEGDPGR